MMSVTKRFAVATLLALPCIGTASAQTPGPQMTCDEDWSGRWNRRSTVCEIREFDVDATDSLFVDGGANGGVRVRAWDGTDILVRARVRAWARDDAEARELADAVSIRVGDTISADGPNPRQASWNVSYEVMAPASTAFRIETQNGGIAIHDIEGNLDLDAVNGGIAIEGAPGNVRGHTTNGGIAITLTGETLNGESLDMDATNGGIVLRIPEGYSARLEAGAVNGGVHVGFPVTVQGRIGRQIQTTLGEGGPLVRVRAVNGGVSISRR